MSGPLDEVETKSDEDPIANRLRATSPTNLTENKDAMMDSNVQSELKEESKAEESAVSESRKRLGISVSLPSNGVPVVNELEDRELNELASTLVGERVSNGEHMVHIQALRDHWRNSTARFIPLKELGPLLRDYQHQITRRHLGVRDGNELQEPARWKQTSGARKIGFYTDCDTSRDKDAFSLSPHRSLQLNSAEAVTYAKSVMRLTGVTVQHRNLGSTEARQGSRFAVRKRKRAGSAPEAHGSAIPEIVCSTPPPSSTPPLPADTDLDQVPEPQIELPRALKRLKRGLPEKRELPTTPFWSVEDDMEEFLILIC
ncbi:hypothetical protein ACLB2K_051037 [Fragaria x ananassa]